MSIQKEVISEGCRVSEEAIAHHHDFLMTHLFKEFPSGTTCELDAVFTTLSYLHHRYIIQVPQSEKVLSLIVLANYIGQDRILTDHLKGDFAFLTVERDKQISPIRVLEGEFSEFKRKLYTKVITGFNFIG